MKTIKQIIFQQVRICLILAFAILTACSDKDEAILTIDSDFQITSNDMNVVIEYSKDDQGTPVLLEWDRTKASDHTTVFYEIQFADNTGSFETPAIIMVPNNVGYDNFYQLSQRNLDAVCERNGIKQGKSGEVKWRINATNGIASCLSKNERKINFTRSSNFAETPQKLYVYGSALGKDKIEDAIELKKISDNSYQFFYELKNGDFYLVNNKDGDNIRHYSIDNSKLEEDGKTTITTSASPSRMLINFDLEAVSFINRVKVVNLFWGISSEKDQMTFAAPSSWTLNNYLMKSRIDDKNKRDQRYKFQIVEIESNGNEKISYWGGVNKNAPTENPSGATSATYFHIAESGNATSTEFTFKFNLAFENEKVDIKVDLSADIADYTHSIDFTK